MTNRSNNNRRIWAQRSRALVGGVVALALTACPTLVGADEGQPAGPPDQAGVSPKRPRFGVGWDEGVALRLRLGPRWGVGLRVNPDLVDADESWMDAYSYTDEPEEAPGTVPVPDRRWRSSYEWESNAESDRKTFAISGMLYYDRDFGRWFSAGPYLSLNYTRLTRDATERFHYRSSWEGPTPRDSGENEEWAELTSRYWERNVGVELGARPVLKLHEHLALETRFGVEWLFTKWTEEGEQTGNWGVMPVEPPTEVPPPPVVAETATGLGTSESRFERSGSSDRFRAVGDRILSEFQIRLIVYF